MLRQMYAWFEVRTYQLVILRLTVAGVFITVQSIARDTGAPVAGN